MHCHVIELRRNGLRLRQDEWPAPVSGELEIICNDARDNNYRRTIRKAVLYVREGVASRRTGKIMMADPVMLHTLPDGFVLRGIALNSTMVDNVIRVSEHEQMWLCLTRWSGTLPQKLTYRLPEA